MLKILALTKIPRTADKSHVSSYPGRQKEGIDLLQQNRIHFFKLQYILELTKTSWILTNIDSLCKDLLHKFF